MKSLNEMKLELEDIEKELRNMKSLCESENREPTDDDTEKANEYLSRADKLDELIAVEERRIKLESRFANTDKPDEAKKMKSNPEKRDKKYDRGNSSPFPSLGEQLMAAVDAGRGVRMDRRLHEVRAATGLSEGIGSDGGFLVQPQYSTEILKMAFDTGVLASRCRRIPMQSNRLVIPGLDETSRADGSRQGGVRGYWTAEAATKTGSTPKFRQIELNASKMVVMVYATDELLEDANALEAYVRQAAASEIGFKIDDALINGSGGGQPLGILNAGCLVTQAAEVGQAAATFLYENATKMWTRLFPKSQMNAVWLINQNVWPQLFTMNLAIGTGGSAVFMPAGGASGSPYATLFGRPIIPIEQCQSIGTVGDIFLADMGGYILGERGGLKTDMSIHVAFTSDQSVFRFVIRLDGQPELGSAITPYKGGSSWTQSHFVALATRS